MIKKHMEVCYVAMRSSIRTGTEHDYRKYLMMS
jgi:hypothetical protein